MKITRKNNGLYQAIFKDLTGRVCGGFGNTMAQAIENCFFDFEN